MDIPGVCKQFPRYDVVRGFLKPAEQERFNKKLYMFAKIIYDNIANEQLIVDLLKPARYKKEVVETIMMAVTLSTEFNIRKTIWHHLAEIVNKNAVIPYSGNENPVKRKRKKTDNYHGK